MIANEPKGTPKTDPHAEPKAAPPAQSPQSATKDPQSHEPKWPGGGKKGEDEK